MQDSKLVRYLYSLKNKEWRAFEKYLQSIFRSGTDCLRLFEYIFKNRKRVYRDELDMLKIQKELFPHLPTKSIQNLASVLVRHLEDFWTIEDLKGQEIRWSALKFESLNKRGFYKEADRLFHEFESKNQSDNHLDLWVKYYGLRMYHERYFSNHPVKQNRSEGNRFLQKTFHLKKQVISDLAMYYTAELRNMEQLYGDDWSQEIAFHGKVIHLEERPLSKCLQAQSDLIDRNYAEFPHLLWDLIFDDTSDMSDSLRITFFYRIRRYLRIKSRTGDSKARTMLKELLLKSLNSKKFIYNEQIANHRFVSDLNTLCQLGEVEAANQYVDKFIQWVPKKERQELEVLGRMQIHFANNNYTEVIQLFLRHSFKKVSDRLQASGLYLKAYFVEDNRDLVFLEMKIRNLKDFIRRNRIHLSKRQRASWTNFIKAYEMMVYNMGNEEIINFVNSCENIIDRIWIRKQLKGGA